MTQLLSQDDVENVFSERLSFLSQSFGLVSLFEQLYGVVHLVAVFVQVNENYLRQNGAKSTALRLNMAIIYYHC